MVGFWAVALNEQALKPKVATDNANKTACFIIVS
ncbi:hypothetical protein E9O_03314 [Moraxella catarrhalis 12P80B1]|nr:hypothetical protein E9O_03314 [Moraxella catarrhalis 12P80B1]